MRLLRRQVLNVNMNRDLFRGSSAPYRVLFISKVLMTLQGFFFQISCHFMSLDVWIFGLIPLIITEMKVNVP